MISVYLAAALSCASRMRKWALLLRTNGFHVVSGWHDTTDREDPHSHEVRRTILIANLLDLRRADVVLADTVEGLPGCTFAEIGYAAALEKPVVWLQPVGKREDGVRARCLVDSHHVVSVVHTDGAVIPTLQRVADGLFKVSA